MHLKDWKVYLFCLGLVVAAEMLGPFKVAFGMLSFTLQPMLYALVFGILLAQVKAIDRKTMDIASPYIGISVMFLTAYMGTTVGPNLGVLTKSGVAVLLQELGNVFTVLLAMPVAVYVFKMGRAAVGASFSISREGSLAIVGDVYGLDSPEGKGVMGGYITGTLIGTIFNGLLVSFLVGLNLFHPYALGLAAGTGSASMMTAALGPLIQAYPEMAQQLTAYAASSQMLSSVDGLYFSLFMTLPLANWMYKKFGGTKKALAAGHVSEQEMALMKSREHLDVLSADRQSIQETEDNMEVRS